MKRPILAFAVGLVVWVVVISLLNRGLRTFVTGYAAAEPTFSFTLGMLVLRLAIAALTSLIAGAAAAWIGPAGRRLPLGAWLMHAGTRAAAPAGGAGR